MDYNQYEKLKEKNTIRNEKLLKDFERWLVSSGVTSKTVEKHVRNTDFYINEFLTYYEVREAESGWYKIDEFFSDWFIRKAMWASEHSVKENITSLKKFYLYLTEIELIDSSDYNMMLEDINKNKFIWIKLVNGAYEDDRKDFYNSDNPDEHILYEERIERNSGKLTELFTHIKQFSMLDAWTWLGDTEIFGIKFNNEDEIYFCCVLGNAGESFGISIYKGIEGLQAYFRILEGDFDLEEEAIHVMDCTTINYENRNDIENVDYELIQSSGVKFRGKKQWPCIRIYEPGFYPSGLDLEDDEEIEELARIIEVVPRYAMYLKENMDKASLMSQGKCIIREFDDEDEVFEEYILDYDNFLSSDGQPMEIPIMYSEIDIKRVIKNCERTKDVWELDIFNMITPVEEDDEVIFPAVMLIVDINNQLIIGQHVTHPYSIEEFQLYLLNMIRNCKTIPKTIIIKVNNNITYLYDLFEKLGIKIEVVKELKLIPIVKKDMFESIKKYNM